VLAITSVSFDSLFLIVCLAFELIV
jgi:hypothetical protein